MYPKWHKNKYIHLTLILKINIKSCLFNTDYTYNLHIYKYIIFSFKANINNKRKVCISIHY